MIRQTLMPKRDFLCAIILCLLAITGETFSQIVSVSKEISIKSDLAYDIFTDLPDNIILYRDKGRNLKFEVFDRQLKYLYSQNISLDDKKDNIAHVINKDGIINVYYTHKEDDIYQLKVKSYNSEGSPIDTALLVMDRGDLFAKTLGSVESEDRSKIALFRYHQKKLHYFIIDNDSLSVISHSTLGRKRRKYSDAISDVLLSNKGVFFLVQSSDFESGGKNNVINIKKMDLSGNNYTFKLLFEEAFSQKLVIDIDSKRNLLVVAGLLESENSYSSQSYFLNKVSIDEWPEKESIKEYRLSEDIVKRVNGSAYNKRKDIFHYDFTDLLFREDGGVMLIAEYSKIIYRRSSYGGRGRRFGNEMGFRNLTDYYNENLLLFNIDPSDKISWETVLHKKQYSQDDGGFFSSYFAYITPSRIRLLYNDEIKANSTVSEYVLDPLGNFERNSVLSTEYQNLRLRIQDAIQISPNEIIVPSEKSNKLKLVKISF